MEHLLISVRTKNKVFGICFVRGKDNYFGLAELGPFLSTSQSFLDTGNVPGTLDIFI